MGGILFSADDGCMRFELLYCWWEKLVCGAGLKIVATVLGSELVMGTLWIEYSCPLHSFFLLFLFISYSLSYLNIRLSKTIH